MFCVPFLGLKSQLEQGKSLSVLSSGISMLFEDILHFLVYRLWREALPMLMVVWSKATRSFAWMVTTWLRAHKNRRPQFSRWPRANWWCKCEGSKSATGNTNSSSNSSSNRAMEPRRRGVGQEGMYYVLSLHFIYWHNSNKMPQAVWRHFILQVLRDFKFFSGKIFFFPKNLNVLAI